jgi:hypothetical protein
MKRSIFAVLAALALLGAAPLVAQQQENGRQPYESRTNPNAPNITDQSGLTITGTVVKSTDKQLTLRTIDGIEHVQLVPSTEKPVDLTAGENVSVDYTRNDQGVMIARKIRPEGKAEGAKHGMKHRGSGSAGR